MPLHIVLFEPLIPANTGNIARTCAATNTQLHLIKPLGFSTDDKSLKRAGLDYWEYVDITYYENLKQFFSVNHEGRHYYITKFAEQVYSDPDYSNVDEDIFFIFGKETDGLPNELLAENPERGLKVPMHDDYVRSLNLSNVATVILYEALRQQEFGDLNQIGFSGKDTRYPHLNSD